MTYALIAAVWIALAAAVRAALRLWREMQDDDAIVIRDADGERIVGVIGKAKDLEGRVVGRRWWL